jgi:hypothetical protein
MGAFAVNHCRNNGKSKPASACEEAKKALAMASASVQGAAVFQPPSLSLGGLEAAAPCLLFRDPLVDSLQHVVHASIDVTGQLF